MIDYGTILSVVIGGALSLLGSVVAHYLQNRSELRRHQWEQKKERLMEIRRYLAACLEFADLVSIPFALEPMGFGEDQRSEWIERMKELEEKWKSLPAAGSGRVLFTDDKDLLQGLEQVDQLRVWFYYSYRRSLEGKISSEYDKKRDELKSLAERLASKLDRLLDTPAS